MRMHKAKAHKKVLPDNTIPLINIVFLMLIFFLIAGTIAPSISPDLNPAQSQALPKTAPAGNALEILKDGTLIHQGLRLSLEEAIAQFPALSYDPSHKAPQPAPASDERTLHILADKELSTASLIPILQAFRAAGHKNIRLVTLRESH
nr:biopolymer transporter ExbD [uncultured Cohaesibacter sp.]